MGFGFYATFIIGAVVLLFGVVLLAAKGVQGTSTIKMPGLELQLPGIAIVAGLGFALMIAAYTLFAKAPDPEPRPAPAVTPSATPRSSPAPVPTPARTPPRLDVVSVEELGRRLKSGDAAERQKAAADLVRSKERAVPFLVQGLEDPDPAVRSEVLNSLEKIGHAAKDALPAVRASWERYQATGPKTALLTLQYGQTMCAINPECKGS